MGSIDDLHWAPRLPQSLIQRLYELDAQGLRDLELLEDVGYRLRARCESFIAAADAAMGRAPCPRCGAVIIHSARPEEELVCPDCGWNILWKDYFSSFQHKQLSGAEPIKAVFRDFVQRFPSLREPEEKMLAIDQLLHAFHLYFKDLEETRAAAVNLIEGRYHEVVDFLDRLSYGSGSTPGLPQNWRTWRDTLDRTAEKWQDERLKRKPSDEE